MLQLLSRNAVVVEKPKHAFHRSAVEEVVARVVWIAAIGIDRLEFSDGQALQAVVRSCQPNSLVRIALVMELPCGRKRCRIEKFLEASQTATGFMHQQSPLVDQIVAYGSVVATVVVEIDE